MTPSRDVEAHPEGQARLAHRWARRHDDEIADGEALGVVVDLAEAGRDPAHLEWPLHAIGEVLVVGLQRGGDMAQLRIRRFVAEGEETLLGSVERERNV